jgi:hypothetical protein
MVWVAEPTGVGKSVTSTPTGSHTRDQYIVFSQFLIANLTFGPVGDMSLRGSAQPIDAADNTLNYTHCVCSHVANIKHLMSRRVNPSVADILNTDAISSQSRRKYCTGENVVSLREWRSILRN